MSLTDGAVAITFDALVDLLSPPPDARRIVAIVGAPASGKSTVSEALVDALNARHPGATALLQMDGFHLDDPLLEERGLRQRKGSPETFDVGGLCGLLSRLRDGREPEVFAPRFDRSIEISRGGAVAIPVSARTIVVEGNWLLLDQPPWRDVADAFDLSVAIAPSEDLLRDRLMARWAHLGADVARRKTEENDLPNARLVKSQSRPATYLLQDIPDL